METSLLQPLLDLASQPENEATQRSVTQVLNGLLGALAIPDPPQLVTSLLYATVDTVYGLIPQNIKVGPLMEY